MITWILLSLASAVLATANKAGSTAFYLYNNNDVELVGPFPDDKFLPLFKKYGEVDLNKNTVFLTAGKPNQQAGLWSKRQMTERNWQMVVAFRVKGEAIGGNGLGLWYTRDGHRTGSVYGGPDKFDGLGIFIDTFDEETKSETVPMVVGMLGDGHTPFKQASNTTSADAKVIGSCFKSIRNTDAPVYVRVTYFNRHVRLEIDNQSEGRSYTTCFDAYNIDLPIGNYFGVSASTNIYPDQYEVYAMKTAIFSTVSRHADGAATDKMEEAEVFRDPSTIAKLMDGMTQMISKQNDLLVDFRSVVGKTANDQLPLNNRMEALERDIRHLDNHLDRIEETLHAVTLLIKKLAKENDIKMVASKISSLNQNNIVQNIQENIVGYSMLLCVQALIIVVMLMYIRSKNQKPQRKAL